MTNKDARGTCSIWRAVVCVLVLTMGNGARAAVTLDGTLGPAAGSLTGPDYVIPAQLGDIRGANLFHSFGQFGVYRGESATFTGPASVQKIIGRVTGGETSNIDGLVRSSISGANLYLINPSGVVFGPNARLDVSGSFYASTADYLGFGDGGRFDARNPGASILTSAPPAAFGFLGPPAPITVSGSLSVSTGKSLGLVGGNLTISGDAAFLGAPSGRVDLVAINSAGEVPLSPSAHDISAFSTLGDVLVSDNAVVSTAGDPGGTIYIRGGRLVIESALLDSGTLGATDHPGIGIDIAARGEFTVGVSSDLNAPDALIDSSSVGTGRAGAIHIEAGNFKLTGDPTAGVGASAGRYAEVFSGAFDLGRGGDIVVNAGQVEIGPNANIQTESTGTGNAGDISINANSLHIEGSSGDGSFISTSSHAGIIINPNAAQVNGSTGGAGSLFISASDILMQGGGSKSSVGLFIDNENKSGLALNGGSLTLTADSLQVLDGAQISTTRVGAGSGGNMNISAGEILIAGQDGSGSAAGIFSSAVGSGADAAGNVSIAAGSLIMSRHGLIDSESDSTRAGNIQITAQNMELSDGALLSVSALGSEFGGISIDAARVQLTGGTGVQTGIVVRGGPDLVGGGIRIDSVELQILDGATIVSHSSPIATVPILIHSDRVLVSGDGSSITADSFGVSSRLLSVVTDDISLEAGDLVVRDLGSIIVRSLSDHAGQMTIAADNISLSNGFLSAGSTYTTTGTGNISVVARGSLNMQNSAISAAAVNATGGNITITAGSAVRLDNSSVSASVAGFAGVGGGNIRVAADTISLSGDSLISATSSSGGAAGDIELAARDALTMRDSEVSTQSVQSAGGNITVAARSMIDLNNSAITASVEGGIGNGGNISIDPEFLVLKHSHIAADAIGGNGGNVTIVAGNFLASPDSSVTASSVVGVQGNVVIRAPTQDLSGDLAILPETAIDASTRFKSNCAVVNSRFSSFTMAGSAVSSAGLGIMPSAYSSIGVDNGTMANGRGISSAKLMRPQAAVLPAVECRF